MSAVFGFRVKQSDTAQPQKMMMELLHWNEPYGRVALEHRLLSSAGLGCCVEHFSDAFPYGGPVLEEDGVYAVLDTLLYNREELLPMLPRWEGDCISDEQLLWSLIRSKGYEVLAQVNGDFAGAVYDSKQDKWTLFRDHLGVRPLYYYHEGGQFCFSTDLRGVVSYLGADCKPNGQKVFQSINRLNQLSLCETEYDQVFCVPPGTVMEVSMRGTQVRPYWSLRRKKIRLDSDAAYIAEMRRLITDAVKRRAEAISGTLGAELSGGLDSSVIGILLNRMGRKTVYYSWSQSPEKLPIRAGTDERKTILDICRQEGIDVRFHEGPESLSLEFLLENAVPAYTDTYKISLGSQWMHSQGARVVFSGHGGDEGVSHRSLSYEMAYNHEWAAYWKYYWNLTGKRKLRALRTLKRAAMAWKEERSICDNQTKFGVTNHTKMLKPEFEMRMVGSYQSERMYFFLEPHRYVNQGGTRPRLDNAAFQGALSGVRYLFPYVDYRVMDFALSIPRHLYIRTESDRWIFREAFRDIIPDSLYHVNYKDYASQRDLRAKIPKMEYHAQLPNFMDLLDRQWWYDYLNFTLLDSFVPKTLNQVEEIQGHVRLCICLQYCLLIQNVRDKTKQWRDDNGS